LTRLPLPPGPPSKLFSGNVHQIPRNEPWKTYAQWSKIFGPVLHLRVYTQRIIVLNTVQAVQDLLDSKSSLYSDRPVVWMYKELVGRKWAVFNISSTHPHFRKYRSLLCSVLGTQDMVKHYQMLQDRDSVVLLRNLHRNPDEFRAHIRRQVHFSVILEFAYGWNVKDQDDYLVSLMAKSFELQAEIVRPGRWLVDVFPFLCFVPSWFPGGGFKQKALEYRRLMDPIDQFPHEWAKEQMASGDYLKSFTSMQMQAHEEGMEEGMEDIIRWCSAALYAGGADTIVSVMSSFFLLMTLNPLAQTRAQEEIDKVLGLDELPTINDRDKLPYVSALIKEVLRWVPPAPLGLPHRVLDDDVYNGYRIPKGSTIVANIWNILHAEELYPKPWEFAPERHIAQEKLGIEPQSSLNPDPQKFVYGFGRRVCPGAQLAGDGLFVNISRILACFNIRKVKDKSGNEIEPAVEFTTTATSHPKPFLCSIIPRASKRTEL
ncbi:cytochrome P450, partial [Dendrothele bispora CBS 962.96]